jgi:hypothetical protein
MTVRTLADRNTGMAVQWEYSSSHLVEQLERILLAVDDLECRDLLS